jgi:hypothetical protein
VRLIQLRLSVYRSVVVDCDRSVRGAIIIDQRASCVNRRMIERRKGRSTPEDRSDPKALERWASR